MKNILIILFVFCFIIINAQNGAVVQANELLVKQKYAAAYNVLRDSDPNNQMPDITIAKMKLLLEYNINNEMFRSFSLKDLNDGEKLDELRESQPKTPIIYYKPDSVVETLIRRFPNNYELRNALGNFYYEVHLKYSDDTWELPDSIVVEKMMENYLDAYNNGVYDYWSLFGIGYGYLLDDENEKAIPFFEKSIDLNQNYPITYYNLACAYSNLEKYPPSIENAEKALSMYELPEYKAEAAKLIGVGYNGLKNKEKALEYFRMANEFLPHDFDALSPMLKLEISMDKPEYKSHTEELFMLAPENPAVFQDILEDYSENEKEKEFIEFMEVQKNKFRTNLTIQANIYFYTAVAQYQIDEWVPAKINFEKARSLFRNLFKPEHSVFKVIDSYTNAIKKK